MLAQQYEYFMVEKLMLTFSFVSNWLKARGAIAMAYVSDPDIYYPTFLDFMRQETAVLIRDVKNHVWEVPIFKKWLYTKPGKQLRLYSLGHIIIWSKPKVPGDGSGGLNDDAPFSVTVDSIIKFKRETLIQSYAPTLTIQKWAGIRDPLDVTVVFPSGDVRSATIRIKVNQGAIKEDMVNCFLTYTFPIDFLFTITDGTAPESRSVTFSERFTSGTWDSVASGYIMLNIPSDIATRVDFDHFDVKSVSATLPGDYPFENVCMVYSNVPLRDATTVDFTGVEMKPLLNYSK